MGHQKKNREKGSSGFSNARFVLILCFAVFALAILIVVLSSKEKGISKPLEGVFGFGEYTSSQELDYFSVSGTVKEASDQAAVLDGNGKEWVISFDVNTTFVKQECRKVGADERREIEEGTIDGVAPSQMCTLVGVSRTDISSGKQISVTMRPQEKSKKTSGIAEQVILLEK